MSSETPSGAFVEYDPSRPGAERALAAEVPATVIDPAPVVSWHGSSFDLMTGLDVSDESDSIPGELFDRLFRSPEPR